MPHTATDDPISKLLDETLSGVLTEKPDPRLRARARLLRTLGMTLLLLAVACVVAISLLSIPQPLIAIRTLVLLGAAVSALAAGGWLIDKAGKEEIQACKHGSDVLRDVLHSAPGLTSPATNRRRKQFGWSMLVFAIFCVCIAAAPLPGKGVWDVISWTGFAVLFLVVGGWQIRKATKDSYRAEKMASSAQLRIARGAGRHVRRVK